MFKLFEWIYGTNSIVPIDFMAACYRKCCCQIVLWTHFKEAIDFHVNPHYLVLRSMLNDN